MKKKRKRLSRINDYLEHLADSRLLTNLELALKSQANEKIERLVREEELKWYQRSKAQWRDKGIQDTFIWWLMAGIGRIIYVIFMKMRA
jgi:hypothetical protein